MILSFEKHSYWNSALHSFPKKGHRFTAGGQVDGKLIKTFAISSFLINLEIYSSSIPKIGPSSSTRVVTFIPFPLNRQVNHSHDISFIFRLPKIFYVYLPWSKYFTFFSLQWIYFTFSDEGIFETFHVEDILLEVSMLRKFCFHFLWWQYLTFTFIKRVFTFTLHREGVLLSLSLIKVFHF